MRRDKVKRIVDGKLEEAEAPLLCKLLDWDAENIAYPSGAAKKSRCVQRGCRQPKWHTFVLIRLVLAQEEQNKNPLYRYPVKRVPIQQQVLHIILPRPE